MRSSLASAVLLGVGCVTAPSLEVLSSGGTGTDGQDAGEGEPSGPVESAAADDTGSAPGETEAETDGGSSGCGDDCGDAPELAWLTFGEDSDGDATCRTVVPDGSGGLIASFRSTGFDMYYGQVVAIDADGHHAATGGTANADLFPGLSVRAEGFIDWASFAGNVGIADATLANLEGGPLAFDVAELRAMAPDGDRLRYVARLTPSFNCVVRLGADATFDSVPFTCAEPWYPEELHHDGQGSWYYFDPLAYRVIRFDPEGLSWGSVEGRWNRLALDGAVDPEGRVWFVGAIGSGHDAVYGSFVARHGFDIAEEPEWERAVEDDDVVWTAIAMADGGPVVFGHQGWGERLHAMGLSFEGDVRWMWEHEPEPRTYVDVVAIDDAGDAVACGYRYTGQQTPIGTDVNYPMYMKLSL